MVLQAYYYFGVFPPLTFAVASTAVLLGLSALKEVFEFGGARVVGEREGVLIIGTGDHDKWDTQKDMVNNLVGATCG